MPSNSNSKEELCPQTRPRSTSATEATKPEIAARRQRPVLTQQGIRIYSLFLMRFLINKEKHRNQNAKRKNK